MAAPLGRCGCQKFVRNYLTAWSRLSYGSACRQHTTAAQENTQSKHQDSPEEKKIVIPRRKKWDGVEVLRALASTVEYNFQGPHYKYIDDPYLIPATAGEKRRFTLAKASGRKAAKYIANEWPQHFEFSRADPPIQAYEANLGYRHAEDSEDGLMERIEARSPLAALASYQKMKEAGHAASPQTLTNLLGLLCAYNSKERPQSMELEENALRLDSAKDNAVKMRKYQKTWKKLGSAEQLFTEMSEKTPKDYSHLLRGRAKHLDAEKAYELYQEMNTQNIPVDPEAYNALLRVVYYLPNLSEAKWQIARDILKDMAHAGIRPTLTTFNNLLFTLSRCNRYRQCGSWIMEVLNEMKELGIEPSLGCWCHVLNVFYLRDSEATSTILYEILDSLEGKEFTLHHQDDLDFFVKAMSVCFNLKDMELAFKLDRLASTGNNHHFLGESFKESSFYTYFLQLLCMFEQIDTIMEYYDKFTPHVYTPTFGALNELLQAIELNEGYRYLPQMWSDLVLFDYSRRTDLVESLLHCMAQKKHEPELQVKFVKIADDLKKRLQEDLDNPRRFVKSLQLSGKMIGDLVLIIMNAGDLDKAWTFFEIYLTKKYQMENFPSENSLVSLAEACIEKQDISKLMECLAVMADCAYPKLDDLLDRSQEELQLTEEQRNHLEDLR